ncbi:MAG: hypothetical protein DI543_22640, partial [Bradyrhizobium icense]
MGRTRLGLAVVSMVVSAAVGAMLWPNARDALAVLTVQDDPAALADLQLNSALRNNPGLIHDNIETALAAGDADLAGSFAELARDKDVALSDDLSKRVGDAAAHDNSAGQFAKRFATGLVTGNSDDVASLSGTVAGDLFVWGDIRDAAREGKHLVMGE